MTLWMGVFDSYLNSKSAFCAQTGRRPAALLDSGLKTAGMTQGGNAKMTGDGSCRNDAVDVCPEDVAPMLALMPLTPPSLSSLEERV
jgi:hypothetical protein